MKLASATEAAAALARGEMILVVDDEDRENEGDFVIAAEHATPEQLAFIIRHSSGVLCAPMVAEDLDRLDLPPMVRDNEDPKSTAYTITCDARDGVSTGISAADRAQTLRVLADPSTDASALTRPGHVLPLQYAAGGVLRRPGHTEASVDYLRMAGCRPVACIAEVTNDDGTMARMDDLEAFAAEHDLLLTTIADLVAHRREHDAIATRVAEASLPTTHGTWRVITYEGTHAPAGAVALVMGDPAGEDAVLVRMHSECLTGDVFGSTRCDCGPQLDEAMTQIAREGVGVVVYLQGHEGRGIGITAKIKAYALQEDGADTVDANQLLGLPIDARDYGVGAHVLADLGVRRLRLMTNNPIKRRALSGFGLSVVERVPLTVGVSDANRDYLATKAERMGHVIDLRIADEPARVGLAGPR